MTWVHRPLAWAWLFVFFAVLGWSVVNPKDLATWFLEVLPALVALAVMAYTYERFPLTPLLYVLILMHCVVLMVGGHYTYAEVPLFDTIAEWLGQERNNYDKVGHFFQGFVPALVAREILLRRHVVNGRGWLNAIIISVALAISAFYELVEWWVALMSAEAADAFLGTQGYVWDTQSDMLLALIGAVTALLVLSRWHDKQLAIDAAKYP